ncbi:aldo/keto reductase [Pseudoxanthomonas composti]|uniref:Aldo/keto reductase n=1 Tax=Pseudoxanthomonas composti TaxID=2137479 RepID=A0A4V1N1H2_9GAMM|nr:aldo/keto reductase [Pseudoxanthomonas composti]RXR08288.1 aldo/keto reductase [Pseudoxanthomonas composti]
MPTPTTRLGGQDVAVLGQGTWNMGDDPARRKAEIEALQSGIDLGLSLIDTAEMYGEGASERLVGEAIKGRREAAFIVSKAYPQNASRGRLPQACERSLRNLGIDCIDLYLLHWRGAVPLAETVEAMQALRQAGKIRHWGVSNLDVEDMEELLDAGGTHCATDQILYNLTRRGPEHDLLPWLEQRDIAAMAYSPVEQGRLKGHKTLASIAQRHGASDLQVALAWVLRREGVIAIPKAGSRRHVEENAAALSLTLTGDDLAELDRAFPPPGGKRALEML